MYIKIKEIKSRYSPNIKGILHLGAHHGEEAQEYYEADYQPVIWIEGNPDLMPQLKSNISKYPGNVAYNLLISDKDNAEVNFNITEFSQSSSILELGITKEIHKTAIIEKKPLITYRLDNFFIKNQLDINQYNFVNLDLQGYELFALKSMGSLINSVDWIYAEVNVKSLYKDCALMYQMDMFLLHKGFIRVQTYMTTFFWGDALYKRKKIGDVEKLLRIAGIYSEETARVVVGFIKNTFLNTKRTIKKVLKKIIFKR